MRAVGTVLRCPPVLRRTVLWRAVDFGHPVNCYSRTAARFRRARGLRGLANLILTAIAPPERQSSLCVGSWAPVGHSAVSPSHHQQRGAARILCQMPCTAPCGSALTRSTAAHMPLDGLVGGASTATGIFSGFFVPREERHTADLDMDFGRTELEIMSRNLGDVGSDETNRQVQDWATLPTLARAKQAGRWRRSVP